MTVAELIEKLSAFEPNMPIEIELSNEDGDYITESNELFMELLEDKSGKGDILYITNLEE